MQKFYLSLLCCFFFSFCASAQEFEAAFQPTEIDKLYKIYPLDNGEIMVAAYGTQFEYVVLNTYNRIYKANGIEKTLNPLATFDPEHYEEHKAAVGNFFNFATFSDAGNAYLSMDYFDCDIYWGIGIIQLNQQGEVNTYNNLDKNIISINDTLYDVKGSTLKLFDENFNLLKSITLPISFSVRDIIKANQHDLILLGNGTILKTSNYLTDATYITQTIENGLYQIDTLSAQFSIVKFKEGSLYGFYKLENSTLEITDTTYLASDETNGDFVCHNNQIYLLGSNQENVFIRVYNENLDVEQTHIIGNRNLIPTNMIQKNGILYLGGTSIDNNIDNYGDLIGSLWLKATPADNISNLVRPDAGVIALSYNNFKLTNGGNCYPFIENYSFDYPHSIAFATLENVQVIVKNFGNDTINSLNIQTLFPACYPHCDARSKGFSVKYDSLALAPNEEREISLGDIEIQNLILKSDSTYNLCFWTSIPNNTIDADYSNNQTCITIDNINVGLENLNAEAETYCIFPNPAKDLLYINIPSENAAQTTLEIFDLSGKNQNLRYTYQNKQIHLDVSTLPEGVFIAKITDPQGNVFVRKFVK
ncbi:MAG: T9SS type A sorting domain-containing protein [Chitinophagales bacterium]|nr:T9SS type A sorting domain-containing protein [Bacteroidota bacterium]